MSLSEVTLIEDLVELVEVFGKVSGKRNEANLAQAYKAYESGLARQNQDFMN